MLDAVLSDAGFATHCVDQGQPALEMIRQRHFDLLVIDINLPDMNGMEICEQAREIYGDTAVILMVTAESRIERLVTSMDLGADDFLPKPFHIDELLGRIEAKLRRTEHNDGTAS
jgi:DNA-binding response OmpR family regulator